MKKILLPLLLLPFLGSCAGVGDSVKGFGKDVVRALPGASTPAEFRVSDGNEISQEEEYWLGRAVAAHLLTSYRPSQNSALNEYVAKVGHTVAAYSRRPDIFGGYSFQVVESDDANAFSAPGGFIFITTGIIRLMTNEDDLAAVLAHEIAHVRYRHGLAAISQAHRSRGIDVAGKIVTAIDCATADKLLLSAFEGAVGDVVQTLIVKGYSRDQEYEADADAFLILGAAGYSTRGLERILNALAKSTQSSGGWFATHPSAEDRLAQLRFEDPDTRSAGRAMRFNKALGIR